MGLKSVIFVLVIAGAGYHYWNKQQTEEIKHQAEAALSTNASSNGFVNLPPLENANSEGVVIFAPVNCPSDAARRADMLAEELSRQGIPFTRASNASFTFSNPDPVVLEKVDAVMSGEVPIVFINGSAKANPTIDEVVDEYGTTES